MKYMDGQLGGAVHDLGVIAASIGTSNTSAIVTVDSGIDNTDGFGSLQVGFVSATSINTPGASNSTTSPPGVTPSPGDDNGDLWVGW
jgi:hypothetical protein